MSGVRSRPGVRRARRSIRAFRRRAGRPRAALDALVEAACLAPAPHHSRPWRFVVVDTDGGQAGARRRHGRRAGAPTSRATASRPAASTSSSTASHAKITRRAGARARLPHVGRPRPLPRRAAPARRVGHGAAVARRRGREPHARGGRRAALASCWVAAPIFCPEAARDALALPAEWLPHALVLVGYPDPTYVGRAPPAGPARRPPPRPLTADA